MGKYDALRNRLDRSLGPVELTFAEISTLVGGLPGSAYRHSAWWSNNERGHVQAEAWLSLDRRVTHVDQPGQLVSFSARHR